MKGLFPRLGRLSRPWKIARNEEGVAAIEFAFLSSVMAFILLGITDVGMVVMQRSDMENSVKAGVNYFMVGGRDPVEAKAVMESAWAYRPEGTEIFVSNICFCGDQIQACNVECSDGSLPVTYYQIAARAQLETVVSEANYVYQDVIRIR
ncbi:MAG: pilus assembly protein [Hyphomonadaceae bacterium]|nr:pilus assembly protein [Hyphomonadaceae bacterium]